MSTSRILVVDDESYIRTIVTAMLEQASLVTVAVADGNEALEAIQADPEFDLVLSDIMMSGMDGMTLLERTLAQLRLEYVDHGKKDLFEQLKATLTEGRGSVAYAQLAAKLGLTEASVKMAVHRLRQRYREVLRAEIAETLMLAAE